MVNSKQLDEYIAYIEWKYEDYMQSAEAAQEIISHVDYSHITVKQSWEDNFVYFHVDNSPTGVGLAFIFPMEMKHHLVPVLDLAINNKW